MFDIVRWFLKNQAQQKKESNIAIQKTEQIKIFLKIFEFLYNNDFSSFHVSLYIAFVKIDNNII